MTGFEAQQAATDGGTLNGTAAYDTTTKRTGAASIRCNPASGVAGYYSPASAAVTGMFVHFGLYVVTFPSLDRVIAGASSSWLTVRLRSDGKLSVFNGASLVGTSSTALSAGQWYWIGYREAVATSVVYLQINEANEVTGTVGAITAPGAGTVGFRLIEASAAEIYIDDVIIDDAGFLAPSKVDIALPISDNTVTGVTDGNAGTTNLWHCVDNTPPAGVASANEAANPQANIRYPASTTENYIANLETYQSLGIGGFDTILAVQSVVRHGEDIATGSKNFQNVGALTNPTVAGASVLLDSGAHGADSPGLWNTTFGTLTTSPSVTLNVSPTIQTSRISEARVACIDFMGMMVAWRPTRVPKTSPYPQLLAQ